MIEYYLFLLKKNNIFFVKYYKNVVTVKINVFFINKS